MEHGCTVMNVVGSIAIIGSMALRVCRLLLCVSNMIVICLNSPLKLGSRERQIVASAIRETCSIRKWQLWTVNVRTNHVHAVVSATKKPEAIVTALKANATRAMKEAGIWTSELSPWSFGGSRKYLWDDKELADAIAYVECDQGDPLD